MTEETELQLREQIRIGAHAAAIEMDLTAYLDILEERAIHTLSNLDISTVMMQKCHVMLCVIEEIKNRIKSDITAGRIAEKELTTQHELV